MLLRLILQNFLQFYNSCLQACLSIGLKNVIESFKFEGSYCELIEACGKTVFIPISARSESLNASVAASIFLWEMRRRG